MLSDRSVANRCRYRGPPALGPVPDKPLAAKRLYTNHRPDLIAIDVGVADSQSSVNMVDGVINATVYSQSQTVSG